MNKKIRKLFVFNLVFCMILTQMLLANPAFASVSSSKVSGQDKYETAVKVSQAGWTSSQYVVLAYGEDFPDALCSVPLAKKYGAPILLTGKSSLPSIVINEIERLRASNVMIVGGEGVISKSIEDYLKNKGKVVSRFAGADRYETSLKVAEHIGSTSEVVLAYGENYPDALSISSIAGAKGMPILLTDIKSMPSSIKSFIGSKKVFVVGGTGVISDSVISSLNFERLSGLDRYGTNVAILKRFSDLNFSKVFIATGLDYAYALVGSPLASKSYSPMVLVDEQMPSETKSFLNGKIASDTQVMAIGNVPDAAISAIAGETVSQDIKILSITPLVQSGRVVRIEFNKPVSTFTRSDITVVNKRTQQVLGVYEVELSSDRIIADVEFMEDSYTAAYLEEGETYTFTLKIDGYNNNYDYIRTSKTTGRVTDIDKDRSRIEVMEGDEDTTWYDVSDSLDIDYEEVLGRKMYLTINDDDVIIGYTLESENVKYDAIEIDTTDEMNVTLISEDKDYNLVGDSDDIETIFRVNGEIEDDPEDLDGEKFDYAKIVLDKSGDIVFMNLYDWEDFMVVTSVDEDGIYGYEENFDIDDFTIVKDGKTIDYEDIKADDMLFYNEDAEYAEVYNKTVKDKIEYVTESDFTLDGEDYTYEINNNYDTEEIQYADDEELVVLDSSDALNVKDDDENITIYLDRAGNGIFVDSGLGGGDSSSFIAYVANESVSSTSRSKTLWNLDIVDENGEYTEYDVDEDDISDDDFFTAPSGLDWGDIDKNSLVKIKLDEDGDLKEVELLDEVEVDNNQNNTVCFEAGDNYVDGYGLNPDTVMFNVEDYDDDNDYDEDDNSIEIEPFEDIDYDKIIKCRVFADDDDEVLAVIVEESDNENTAETKDYVVLVDDDPSKLAGEDTWKMNIWIDGELERYYTEKDENVLGSIDLGAGDIVKVTIDSGTNEILEVTAPASNQIKKGEVENVDTSDDKIEVDGVTYTLESDAGMYDVTSMDEIEEISLKDIDEGDEVTLYLVSSGSKYVRCLLLTDK